VPGRLRDHRRGQSRPDPGGDDHRRHDIGLRWRDDIFDRDQQHRDDSELDDRNGHDERNEHGDQHHDRDDDDDGELHHDRVDHERELDLGDNDVRNDHVELYVDCRCGWSWWVTFGVCESKCSRRSTTSLPASLSRTTFVTDGC
jgi:hypothetical protein